MKSFKQLINEKVEKSALMPAAHWAMDRADRMHHDNHAFKNFGVRTKWHTKEGSDPGSHISYHGTEKNVKKAIEHYHGKTKATIDRNPHLYKGKSRVPGTDLK